MAEAKPSPATVIYEDRPLKFQSAIASERALWLESGELARQTGWERKPEGLCRREICVPVPAAGDGEFAMSRDGRSYLNFAALADQLGKPWAGDLNNRIWYFGAEAAARAGALRTLKAPDFALPDLEGRMHSLPEHRGKKVLLVSWASW